MGGNRRHGKARNQTIGSIDAPWFKANLLRQRKRARMAKRSRRANRKQ